MLLDFTSRCRNSRNAKVSSRALSRWSQQRAGPRACLSTIGYDGNAIDPDMRDTRRQYLDPSVSEPAPAMRPMRGASYELLSNR